MSPTWRSEDEPAPVPITPIGWVRVVLKGGLAGLVTFGCLGLLLLVRLIERPVFGLRRPVTPYITQFVCRAFFVITGIGWLIEGRPMVGDGAAVANHSSWLDIFALNAAKRIYFVSKAEVAGWPGIGWLARATGTVFIRRDRAEAQAQTQVFRDRLRAGHRLMFFPEGTSTDSRRVLPFKTTLFEAFFDDGLRNEMAIQPVSVIYRAPEGQDARFYGWWGDMGFGEHLLKVLAAPRQGSVTLVYHAPVPVAEMANRKQMAQRLEAVVRAGLQDRMAEPGSRPE
mgnify:CR=1 FL=1